MTVAELYSKLSELYPENLRCEWDNDGVMCTDDYSKEINNVLVALDVTEATVDYAIKHGFDLIVSHHPLVFFSQKSLVPASYTQRKLIKLIKAGVTVFSFHTRLDAVDGGVNDVLCKLLNLKNVSKDNLEPIGRVGELTENMELGQFAKNIKSVLNTPFVLYNGNKSVKKVYVVGGDGKDLISRAISMGADTLFTGRASYNTIIDAADMGLNIVEAGHFFTENPICQKICEDISSINPAIKTQIYNSYELKNE